MEDGGVVDRREGGRAGGLDEEGVVVCFGIAREGKVSDSIELEDQCWRGKAKRVGRNVPANERMAATARSSSMTMLTTPPFASWPTHLSRHSWLTLIAPRVEAMVVMPGRVWSTVVGGEDW